MKHMVQIEWDKDVEMESRDIQSYRFATVAELNAFMEGVEAARDTGSHQVLFDSREAPTPADAIQIVCRTCGTDQVLRDAYASWNVDNQEWELQNVFDAAVCEGRCDGETKLDEVNLIDWKKSQEDGAIIS